MFIIIRKCCRLEREILCPNYLFKYSCFIFSNFVQIRDTRS